MSVKYKSIFERGRFFIETGSARSFETFWKGQSAIKYIPQFMLKRVEDLIDVDKTMAVTLWLKVCEGANAAPQKIRKEIIHYFLHVIFGGMALYAFLHSFF